MVARLVPDDASERIAAAVSGLAAERIVRRAPEDRPDGVLAANDLVAVSLLGRTAVGLVVDQIEGSAPVPAPHVTLGPELVVRASA